MFKVRLKWLRTNKGVNQQDIAKYLQVSRPTYTRYETGEREPDFATLCKLADYFDTSTDYLLGRVDKS